MNTITRTVATTAITTAALIGGTGLAAADVPPATPSLTGDDIVTVGDNGGCNGPIHIDRTTDRAHPGQLTITATPRGDLGARPGCGTSIQVDWVNGIAPFTHSAQHTLDGGPATINVDAGLGASWVTVSILPQRAFAVSNYIWIAP